MEVSRPSLLPNRLGSLRNRRCLPQARSITSTTQYSPAPIRPQGRDKHGPRKQRQHRLHVSRRGSGSGQVLSEFRGPRHRVRGSLAHDRPRSVLPGCRPWKKFPLVEDKLNLNFRADAQRSQPPGVWDGSTGRRQRYLGVRSGSPVLKPVPTVRARAWLSSLCASSSNPTATNPKAPATWRGDFSSVATFPEGFGRASRLRKRNGGESGVSTPLYKAANLWL